MDFLEEEYRRLLPIEQLRPLLIQSANDDRWLLLSQSLALIGRHLYPEDGVVAVVSAYVVWVGVSKEEFDSSVISLLLLMERNDSVGAAGIMLERLSVAETRRSDLRVIERSISAEPSWVENHWQKARALKRMDDLTSSRLALATAQKNCLTPAAAAELDPVGVAWAGIITGQLHDPDRLERSWQNVRPI